MPCVELDLVTSSLRLDMKPGDLVKLSSSDDSNTPSTSASAAHSSDVELLHGRNESTGQEGSFTASCVYVLPSIEKPTPDFVVSTVVYFLSLTLTWTTHVWNFGLTQLNYVSLGLANSYSQM